MAKWTVRIREGKRVGTSFRSGSFHMFVKDYLNEDEEVRLLSALAENREAFKRCFNVSVSD